MVVNFANTITGDNISKFQISRNLIHYNSNIYATGSFDGNINFGDGTTYTSTAAETGFIAKYSLLGEIEQHILFGGSNNTDSVICDSISAINGQICIAGRFRGSVSFNGVDIITGLSICGYLVRYNTNLLYQDIVIFGGSTNNDIIFSPVLINNNTTFIYAYGRYFGTIDFDNTNSINTSSFPGSFIASFNINDLSYTGSVDISGNVMNDTLFSGSVTISSDNKLYYCGSFRGDLKLSPTLSITTATVSGFIAIYDETLNYVNHIIISINNNNLCINTIKCDSNNNIYISGGYIGTITFEGTNTLTNPNTTNLISYIAKYNSTLDFQNSYNIEGITNLGYTLFIDTSDTVYLVGKFEDSILFGGSTFTGDSKGSVFISEFTQNLVYLSTIVFNNYIYDDTPNNLNFNCIDKDTNGNLYILGTFSTTKHAGKTSIDIEGYTISSPSDFASYFIRFGDAITTTTIAPATTSIAPTTTTTTTIAPTTTNTTIAPTTTNTTIAPTTTEPICLPAGSPILTDQGIVLIEKIDSKIHTIANKRIVAITKTITPEKNLVCFGKYTLGMNIPSKRTLMTPGHEVLYKGKLVQAKHFVGRVEGVYNVPYNGKDILYNVLQEKHGLMSVNNMVIETLHPENKVAKKILSEKL